MAKRTTPEQTPRGPASESSSFYLDTLPVSTWPLTRMSTPGRQGLTLLCPQGWDNDVAHPRFSVCLPTSPSGSQKTGSGARGRPRSKGSWAGSWVGLDGTCRGVDSGRHALRVRLTGRSHKCDPQEAQSPPKPACVTRMWCQWHLGTTFTAQGHLTE